MGVGATKEELKIIATQLKKLKELQPQHYYECKGRINALYEKETEKKSVSC